MEKTHKNTFGAAYKLSRKRPPSEKFDKNTAFFNSSGAGAAYPYPMHHRRNRLG